MSRGNTRHPAPVFGSILKPEGHQTHQHELDPIRREHPDLVELMLRETRFIARCRNGEKTLADEPPMTDKERKHAEYERCRRQHPEYYTRQARRERKARHAR